MLVINKLRKHFLEWAFTSRDVVVPSQIVCRAFSMAMAATVQREIERIILHGAVEDGRVLSATCDVYPKAQNTGSAAGFVSRVSV